MRCVEYTAASPDWKECKPLLDPNTEGENGKYGSPYPCGFDPRWHGASHELIYVSDPEAFLRLKSAHAALAVKACLLGGNQQH